MRRTASDSADRIAGPRAVAVSLLLHGAGVGLAFATGAFALAKVTWNAHDQASELREVATAIEWASPRPGQPMPIEIEPERTVPIPIARFDEPIALPLEDIASLPLIEEPEVPPAPGDGGMLPDLADQSKAPPIAVVPQRPETEPEPPTVPAEAPKPPETPPANSNQSASSAVASPLTGENESPRYPFVAWRRRIEGTVLVELDVNELGVVTAVRLERSSGCAMLDDAALAQLAKWRFEPARGPLGPIACTVHQPVVFRRRA
jgi:periplasmic protein TonB